MAAFRPDYRRGEPFGVRDARGRLVLDRRGAADLNAILAELRRLDKMSVAPPLTFGSDAAGRHFGLTRPPSRYVRLSGSASPYAWTDAIRTPGGGSEVVAGGQTGIAYEANSLSGLGGQFLTIDRTAAGDWRCQAIGDGGDGFPFCATGFTCDGKPATVTVSAGGTTLGTGTGQYCFTPTPGVAYTQTATLDGYITATATATNVHGATFSGDASFGNLTLQENWWQPLGSCCDCYPTPDTLTMTSAVESCNFGMFRTGTITWQLAPSDIAGAFTDGTGAPVPTVGYFGDQAWPQDTFDGSGDYVATYHFRYFLTCDRNLWHLTRIFDDFPDGSGGTTTFRDAVLYTWVMGGYLNTCTPFRLDHGNAFAGSDLSCSVTIDG